MSYHRKRHASMMESQKKAAEAANLLAIVSESVTDITPGDSAPTEPAEMSSVATPAVEQTHAQATASIEHEDLEEEEEDDDEESSDDESGIAFLTPAADAKKTRGPAKEKASKGNKNNSAAAQAVLSLQRMHWTKEMDALLLHIVPIYDGKDWVSIAKHMGGEVTNEQCRNRWCCKVDPSLNTCKLGPWEAQEEEQLRVLIAQFTNHPEQDKRGRRRYRDSVHWGAVAKELNRSQKDCRSKWTTLQRSISIQEMRKGPFSPEEDNLVLQRVAEWGDKGQGIWKSLEQELGRPSNNIGNRYRKLIKTYSTTSGENGIVVTPINVLNYLPVDHERKLAAALAPVTHGLHSQMFNNNNNNNHNNGSSSGSSGSNEGGSYNGNGGEMEQVTEEQFLEAATAAAVLAGKKRGRPRSNPLPLLTTAQIMATNQISNNHHSSHNQNNNININNNNNHGMNGNGSSSSSSSGGGYVNGNSNNDAVGTDGTSDAYFGESDANKRQRTEGVNNANNNSSSGSASLPITLSTVTPIPLPIPTTTSSANPTTTSTNPSTNPVSSNQQQQQPINASAEVAAGRSKIGRSSFWNEERDGLLVEAMARYGKDWNSISAHVGEGANCDRCWQRWNRYLKPDAMVSKTDPWTTEDLIQLEDLVLTHTNNPDKRRAGRSTTKTSIDWTTISLLMKRPYMDCKGKWKKIKAFNMKKGPFTGEEDVQIVQRVEELGLSMGAAGTGVVADPPEVTNNEPNAGFPLGFWEELSAHMNRPPEILRARVKTLRNRGTGH